MSKQTGENPLVPDTLLRALLVLMRELRAGAARSRGRQLAGGLSPEGQEAVRASVMLTCNPGDLLCDLSGAGLGRSSAVGKSLRWLDLPARSAAASFTALGAALSLGARAASSLAASSPAAEEAQSPHVLLVLLPALFIRQRAWVTALQLAAEQAAPLVVVTLPEGNTPPPRLKSRRVPLIPVDAHDALALCRVLGESCLRARTGDGPTVVHTVPWELSSQQDPLQRHRQLLRRRGLTA